MTITFCGGAKSVTGSNYLLDTDSSPGGEAGKKILIDCGLFQGSLYAEQLNYQPFAYDPAAIDAVFITHSHADHTGRIPKLYKEGFRGVIYGSEPAIEMMKIALPDNLSLIEHDAGAKLYTLGDLNKAMSLCQGLSYHQPVAIGDVTVILRDAGHILGSAIVEVDFDGKKIYFSGDLGNAPAPLLNPPELPEDASYIVTESTYGDRKHEDKDTRQEILHRVIKETINRGGTLMIPSFAMERTQNLLSEINDLVNEKKIPAVPVFLDSPLAIKLTKVYEKYPNYFNSRARETVKSGDDIFDFPGLKFTLTTEESKKINDVPPPKVIIAGSGMSNGGRILHHERRYLSDPHSTILFISYQAEGSLGRRILDRPAADVAGVLSRNSVKIFGEEIPVRCHIQAIGGYSAHADQPAIVNWIKQGLASNPPAGGLKKVFVVQGEESSALALADKLRELNIEVSIPEANQTYPL